MVERNWAGNLTYRAASVHRPVSLDELRSIVTVGTPLRVLGTRHSFNEIADGERLVSLAALPAEIDVDVRARTVELNPSITYGRLAEVLHAEGLALANLASLPHISIGGAIATGTHGSGDRLGNLATAVSAMEIIRADGSPVRLERGDPDFDGAVVGLGALGVVTRVRLDLEPAYDVTQHVYEDLAWDAFDEHADAITAAGDSVSCFTTWGSSIEQVWVKRRVDAGTRSDPPADLFGARAAVRDLHPIRGTSAEHCTPQLGVAGRWSDRLPHFRMGFTPSSGDELQSELLLPRDQLRGAIAAVRAMADDIRPHLLVSELRTVAPDELWMSGQQGRPTVAIHCTWRSDGAEVLALVGRLEAALAPFAPRPHWGKLFTMPAATVAERWSRHADFVDLVDRYDPSGRFRNGWLVRHVLG